MHPSGKRFDTPQVLAYTYITVKFQRRSSINLQLTEGSLYNRFRIDMSPPPKWGFEVILGVECKDIWWESTFVLRIARFQTYLVQI